MKTQKEQATDNVSTPTIAKIAESAITKPFYQFDDSGSLEIVQPPVQKRKKWWQSRTVWFNTLSTVVAFASSLTPILQPFMTPTSFVTYVAVAGAINKLLRFDTHQAIGIDKKQGD